MTSSSTVSNDGASQESPDDGLVLVAGGTGFVGAAIVDSLVRDRRVAVLTRGGSTALDRLRARHEKAAIEVRVGDVTRPETLARAMAGVSTVVQCVQFPGSPVESARLGRTFLKVDMEGTRNLVAAAVAAGVPRLVYVSGVGADEGSDRVWYRAKGMAEALVRDSGLAWAVVRPSWTYGPADVSLNRFVGLLRSIPLVYPQLGSGRQRVNPVFVDDVGRLVAEAAAGRLDGRTLEIGGRETYSMDEVVRVAMEVVGIRKPILHSPLPVVKLAAWFAQLLPGQLLSVDAVDFITSDAVADLSQLDDSLPGFELRPLADALGSYLGRAVG